MSKVFDQPFFKKVAGSRGRALADVRRRRNTHDFLGVPLLVLFSSIKEKRTAISLDDII
jgi:hypothetical protein